LGQDHLVAGYTQLSARYICSTARSSSPLLVLLHGFTQTGASWGPLSGALSHHFPLVLPDAPGHGGSSEITADLWETADLLARTATRPAIWVGYSMGGRMALHVALAHPEVVQGLVLVSSTAGIEDAGERNRRRAEDEARAALIENEGVERFLSSWLAQPLFATLPPELSGLPERLANTPEGLASSLRHAGTGSQEPLWHKLAELAARALPVLLVAGALDERYCEQARRMAAAIGPSASVAIVAGAGHACHLEHPEEVTAAIAAFCRAITAGLPSSEGQTEGQ